jgi:hypothetical protein
MELRNDKTAKEVYLTARYSPSIATFACQAPNLLTARNAAGPGSTNISAGNTKTTKIKDNTRVILGLTTRK